VLNCVGLNWTGLGFSELSYVGMCWVELDWVTIKSDSHNIAEKLLKVKITKPQPS
jgi:hypothetical protein